MVRIVNIFKAAGVWVGAIFLLYGNQEVSSQTAMIYTGDREALAPTRSPESQGGVQEFRETSRETGAYYGTIRSDAPSRGTQTMFPTRSLTREGGDVTIESHLR